MASRTERTGPDGRAFSAAQPALPVVTGSPVPGRARPGPGVLVALLRRADRRRRARIAFSGAASALWPGLVAAALLVLGWRLTGSNFLAGAAAAVVVLAAIGGGLVRLGRGNLLAAAAELDRRSRPDALLATGFEVTAGRIRGPFASAVLGDAESAASSARAEAVPVTPPRARYLVVPAAVLAGVILLPGGGPRRDGRTAYIAAADPAGEVETDSIKTAHPNGALLDAGPLEAGCVRKAIDEYRERLAREGESQALPAPPPSRRVRSRREKKRDEAGSGPGARGEDAGGDGAAGAAGSEERARLGGGRSGPVDVAEADRIRERFPEYDDLVRRYFAGPRG